MNVLFAYQKIYKRYISIKDEENASEITKSLHKLLNDKENEQKIKKGLTFKVQDPETVLELKDDTTVSIILEMFEEDYTV